MTDQVNVSPMNEKSTSSNKEGTASPSGFVLKLYQMVNGAPDDVISWIPSGDAFLIQNLSKLESDALPRYFRHSRFQSLVRQLNFYNFRKINRERTFWVYRHPLFHRDRPMDLHMLRRRAVSPTAGGVPPTGRGRRGSAGKVDGSGRNSPSRDAHTEYEGKDYGALSESSERENSSGSSSILHRNVDKEFSDEKGTTKNSSIEVGQSSLRSRRKRKSVDSLLLDEDHDNLRTFGEEDSLLGARSSHTRNSRRSFKKERSSLAFGKRHAKRLRRQSSDDAAALDDFSSSSFERNESDDEEERDRRKVVVLFPESNRKRACDMGDSKARDAAPCLPNDGDLHSNENDDMDDDDDDGGNASNKNSPSRSERIQQSLMVSQVAQKLQEHARRASFAVAAYDGARSTTVRGKSGVGGSGPRARGGVITPPSRVSLGRLSDTMKYNALTYDDECGGDVFAETTMATECYGQESGVRKSKGNTRGTSICQANPDELLVVVTDGDDTSVEEDDSSSPTVAGHGIAPLAALHKKSSVAVLANKNEDKKGLLKKYQHQIEGKNARTLPGGRAGNFSASLHEHLNFPPVKDTLMIAIIHRKLLSCLDAKSSIVSSFTSSTHIPKQKESVAAAALAKFCMSTSPRDSNMWEKTHQLMNSYEMLSFEFHRYCTALCPRLAPPGVDIFAASSYGGVVVSNSSGVQSHSNIGSQQKQFLGGKGNDSKDPEHERLFRAFAVNYMENIVQRSTKKNCTISSSNAMGLEQVEKDALKRCRDFWFEGATLE